MQPKRVWFFRLKCGKYVILSASEESIRTKEQRFWDGSFYILIWVTLFETLKNPPFFFKGGV
jgi:hypothetical protein